MQILETENFLAELAPFDEAVAKSPNIDAFCSSAAWVVPAWRAFAGATQIRAFCTGDGGFGAFTEMKHPDGRRYLLPLEAVWMLACPLVGPHPESLAEGLHRLAAEHHHRWHMLLIGGVLEGSALYSELLQRFAKGHTIYSGPECVRQLAYIGDGLDGFMARRSKNFHKSLRQAQRRADALGIVFDDAIFDTSLSIMQDPSCLMRRILAVEALSWKGQEQVGINHGQMRTFYEAMLPALAAKKSLRILFARLDNKDIGYILGGVQNGVYRGLQFSFDQHFAHVSLGNLLQMQQIAKLAAEGVNTYDLGTENPYKQRWAEGRFVTRTLMIGL